MASVDDMIRLARKEVGYSEKNYGQDLYGSESGSGNITKYWKELYETDWFDGMNKQGGEWCAGFVCWLALKATGSKQTGRKMLCQTGALAACCDDAVIYYKEAGRWFTSPKVGDQIFFDYDKEKGNGEDHTGIVEVINGSTITTIEGNSHNKVSRNYYQINDKSIAGYGRPLYDDEPIVEPVKTEVVKGDMLHVVMPGETLSDIAEKYGTTIEMLVRNNDIDNPDLIRIGQVLNIVVAGTPSSGKITAGNGSKTDSAWHLGDLCYLDKDATIWASKRYFDDFVYGTPLYVRQISGTRVVISTLKDGAITGATDIKNLRRP